ncbi:MAG: hypothetical protein IJ242_13040, partial [Clostridia bacterium]|nr:hypothetical protein [Clostridia bacterium]
SLCSKNTPLNNLGSIFRRSYLSEYVKLEAETIMGGVILEFSADKYYEAGRAEGRAIGTAIG